jgi:predicted DNA-binding transcriptional regulator AlpA
MVSTNTTIKEKAPTLLTTRQAAEILGLREQTLANWRNTKSTALPYVKVGRKAIRYEMTAVEEFLQRGRQDV